MLVAREAKCDVYFMPECNISYPLGKYQHHDHLRYYSAILRMEAAESYETLVSTHKTKGAVPWFRGLIVSRAGEPRAIPMQSNSDLRWAK